MYHSCTSHGDPDSRPWCSLRVDRFGNHVSNKEGERFIVNSYASNVQVQVQGIVVS